MSSDGLMVFTGNANPALAQEVVKILGIPLGKAMVSRFSDGEIMVEIQENVRGKDVFVLQSTCAPTNDNLMELMIMVDALKRASAGRITAAIPYFGYARQDRRPRSARVAISAKVVANMLEIAGVERIITMDLHADQIQGFFDIPVDNIYATPVLLGDLRKQNHENLLVVSPDVGGVVRARALAKQLNCDLAIIDKRRPKANVAEVMNIIGEVDGRTCVIMDDPPGSVGWRWSAHRGIGTRRTRRHRHDPAQRRSPLVHEDPLADERRSAGRNVLAYPSRRLGDVAVRGRLKYSRRRRMMNAALLHSA
jgi:ribose-phosphate pyrophosphokinase